MRRRRIMSTKFIEWKPVYEIAICETPIWNKDGSVIFNTKVVGTVKRENANHFCYTAQKLKHPLLTYFQLN